MPNFLIDVNLPYHFSLWKSDRYIHQNDINDEWTDTQIWNYSRQNDLTIISKDSDFSSRVIFHLPPVWDEVLELNKEHKLVTVFRDRLEAIE